VRGSGAGPAPRWAEGREDRADDGRVLDGRDAAHGAAVTVLGFNLLGDGIRDALDLRLTLRCSGPPW
jgi:hypothetical protein